MEHVTNELLDRLDRSPSALAEASDDWGHTVHATPLGVFTPSSVAELAVLVQDAQTAGIAIAARGRGHSTLGQAQVASGIVIDMQALSRVLEVDADSIWVEAGATWRHVLEASLAAGLTPPIFTDYIDLTVGGTLSVGGLGSQTFRAGLQTDNVLELEVITGDGQIMTCSPTAQRDLFDAVRAGLGQCGIITKARLALIPAQPMTRYVRSLHADLETFLTDLFTLAADGRFDGVEGFVVHNSPEGVAQATGNAFPDTALPAGEGTWLYMIEGAKSYTPENAPDTTSLLAGLSVLPSAVNVLDLPYAAYISRLDLVEAALRQIGLWQLPHPWIDVFVPRNAAVDFIRRELAQITPDDVAGPMLIYPYRRSAITTPNVPLPESEEIVLFALLRTALPPTPERVAQLWSANYDIYARCLAAGGTGYAIDAVPLTAQDWQKHFGARWPALVEAKQRYDPAHILAPGQKVF